MDNVLSSQAKLIKSQINILNVTPLSWEEYGDGSVSFQHDGTYKYKGHSAQYIAIYYEFPYRVDGERYWSKQVYWCHLTSDDLLGDIYDKIRDRVTRLRAELED